MKRANECMKKLGILKNMYNFKKFSIIFLNKEKMFFKL